MNAIALIHQKLIAQAGNLNGKSVLDYGCGRGGMIELLLQRPDAPHIIFAIDSDKKAVSQIKKQFSDAISTGRLVAETYSEPKDLSGNQFDVIFCHNVLECVADKETFVKDLYQLLKPNGILLLSHHDFDSAIYNSDFKNLTRNLVYHFADTKQLWQDYHDGQMGRKIPGIFAKAAIKNVTFETWRITETTFEPGDYGFLMSEMILDTCKDNLTAPELKSWKQDLEKKANIKDYYFAVDIVVAKAIHD